MNRNQESVSKAQHARMVYRKPLLHKIEIDNVTPTEQLAFARIKYLFLNDAFSEERLKYLAGMLSPDQSIVKHPIYDDIAPNSNRDMDILLVGGNDHRRLGAFMRVNQLLFMRNPKICLSEKAGVAKRVHLLRSGFDAVINPAVTDPVEASHRIAAIWARYLRTNADIRKSGEVVEALHACCAYDALTQQERQVFHILFEKKGRVATYAELQHAASLDHTPVSHNHLRVLIGSIRLKLLNGWAVSCRREEGYMLQK